MLLLSVHLIFIVIILYKKFLDNLYSFRIYFYFTFSNDKSQFIQFTPYNIIYLLKSYLFLFLCILQIISLIFCTPYNQFLDLKMNSTSSLL